MVVCEVANPTHSPTLSKVRGQVIRDIWYCRRQHNRSHKDLKVIYCGVIKTIPLINNKVWYSWFHAVIRRFESYCLDNFFSLKNLRSMAYVVITWVIFIYIIINIRLSEGFIYDGWISCPPLLF